MKPVLWHIVISHYSEKVRWALDHKDVAYTGRTPPPGSHMPVALWLTRGRHSTFPVLQIDGKVIADSTAIIAAIERRWPQPPLYPAGADARARALALEDHFDEQVAPYIRRFAFHELRQDPEQFAAVGAQAAPQVFRRFGTFATAYGRAFSGVRYGARDDRAAADARVKVIEGLDRLERELDGRDHLVGDTFTVADLTAAAVLAPIVLPPEGPVHLDPLPEAFRRLRAEVEERPGFRWIAETYRRHRRPQPASARP